MKKKNVFFSVLASACLLATAFTVSSCGNNDNKPKEEQYRIYELAKSSGFTGTYEEWLSTVKGADGKDGREIELSIQDNKIVWHYKGETTWKDIYSINDLIGPKGDKGEDGKDGLSISKIIKTSSEDLVDTYTIVYSDGTTSTFVVTNGKDGEQGIQGLPGANGTTPTISINKDGFWVINDVVTEIKAQGIKGEQGNKGEDGKDGKSAYELYLETHPEYKGTVEEWIEDLVNGKLGNEEKIYHTIKFITGCDTVIPDQKVENFYKIKKPVDPIKEGYTFDGWYTSDGKWVFNGYSVTEDVTLTAHWTINDYKVTINLENGTPLETRTITYNEKINLENPIKPGVSFDHWEDENGNVITMPYIVKGDTNIHACYKEITFGTPGYYLFGDGNNWDDEFWLYDNAEIFYLKPEGNVFTLTGSVTAEDLKGITKWGFKVREYDGKDKVFNWYPDGVGNTGFVIEPGEYKFTFNPKSTEQAEKDDGSYEKYTLYTKVERLGEPKLENRLKLSNNIRPNIPEIKGDAKLNLIVDGLEGYSLEGKHLYAYGWQGQFKNNLAEFLPVEGQPGKYSLTMTDVRIGLGPLDVIYEYILLCSPVQLNKETDIDWATMKLNNPNGSNFKAIYNAQKTSATLKINYMEARQYLSVTEAIEVIDALDPTKVTESTLFVTGEVTKVKYDQNHASYTLDLKSPEGKYFKIYSGKLSAGQEAPIVGNHVKAYGRAKIFTNSAGLTTHQIAWDATHRVSPVIVSVWNPTPWYVKGDMNGWANLKEYNLTKVNDTTFEIVCDIAPSPNGFKVATADWSKEVSAKETRLAEGTPAENFELDMVTEKANIKVLVAGTYKLTLTVDTNGMPSLVIALVK